MAYEYNLPSALIGTLSDGTACTPANSGGAAGNAWDFVVGTVTFEGGVWRCADDAYVGRTLDSPQASVSVKFTGGALATGGDTRSISFIAGTTTVLRVEERASDGRIVIYDASGYRWTSPAGAAAPTSGDYRHEVGCSISPTGARIRYALFEDGDASGTPDAAYSIDNGNTGAANITEIRIGRVNSTPTAVREIIYAHSSTDQFALLGPLTTTPPLVSLGDDQVVEPLTDVTLTASHIAGDAPDAWTWSVESDPTGDVVLSGTGASRTLTTPALLTGGVPQQVQVVIGCVPTASGVDGTKQTVTVTVPPCQRWIRTPGTDAWSPSRRSYPTA